LDLNEVTRYGANTVSSERIRDIKRTVLYLQEIGQQPLEICVKRMTQKRKSIGIQSLLLGFTVLLMDEDKSILRITAEN